ncbi:MAG: EAL domain-containing protein [Tissierellia bacterium]|nr:EAL domain-containing protein [Tissierellia bacterium]
MFQILYFFTAFFYLFIGIISVSGDKEKKSKYIFHYISICMFLWTMLLFFSYTTDDFNKINTLRLWTTPFYSICPPLFALFLMTVSRKDLSRRQLLILFLPAILNIIIYGLIYPTTPDLATITKYGPLYRNAIGRGPIYDHYFTLYTIFYVVVAFHEIISFVFFTETERDRFIAKNIAIGMGISTSLALFWDVFLPCFLDFSLPRLTVIFFVPAMFFAYIAITKYNFLDIYPEKLFSKILSALDDGTIITNNLGIIEHFSPGSININLESSPLDMKIEDFFENNDFLEMDEFYDLEINLKDKSIVYLTKETFRDEDGNLLGSNYTFRDAGSVSETQKAFRDLNLSLEKKIKEQTKEIIELEASLNRERNQGIIIEETLDRITHYCPLTGLPNRSLFLDELRTSLSECEESGTPLALLYFNIDAFKSINDDYGYFAGDEVLIKSAKRLTDNLPNYFMARIGADEFGLIIKDYKNIDEIEKISQKIIRLFGEPFNFDFGSKSLNVSIGISLYPDDAMDMETLMQNVDISMHKAKEMEGSVYKFVSAEMKEEVERNFKIRNELKEAIIDGELELYYQPQVDSDKGLIIGFEALIRWNHKSLGFLPPGVFLPVAEKYGLMPNIDRFVLNEAIRQNKEWQDRNLIHVPISVNLSPQEFMSDSLPELVKTTLEEHDLDPKYLELELTEGTLLTDINKVIKIIGKLRDFGVKISIDDFGTEYSSLNYLKTLPASRLKIAKSFIDGIDNNKVDEAIIDAIIVLTDKIGLELIAEGVEEHSQMAYLRDKGCYDIQGFYYYKPMSVEEIEETEVFQINTDRVI